MRTYHQVRCGKTTWEDLEKQDLAKPSSLETVELTRAKVLRRLRRLTPTLSSDTLTCWNKYDPYIQEGLDPERVPCIGLYKSRLRYPEKKICLHETKAAEVRSGRFISLKNVKFDGKVIPAGTEFISPKKA